MTGVSGTRSPVSPEWFGILLLGILFGAIFIGFPIAFTLISIARDRRLRQHSARSRCT